MTCLASNQPYATQHVNLVWADVEPNTGMLDVEDVRRKISTRTKAILLNHFCGYVGYVDEILALAKEKGLYVIEDAIEGFGSEYKGKRVGNLGADVTVYSFQTVRLPNTIDGGAMSFKDKELYEKAILVRDYGIDRPRFRDELKEISPLCDIALPGYGATPSEINSYVGFRQMESITGLLEAQQEQARKWEELLLREGEKPVDIVPGTKPNYWVFGVLAKQKKSFLEAWRTKGYYASGVHLPNSYYSVFGRQSDLRGVQDFYSHYVALPCGWWMR
jgi:dTDP-4-amino-4,6-dideoxygalactose transaminase